jgi:hypothetical protein
MIKRVQTYKRPDGRYSDYYTNYRAIWFEDDQSYYRAVTWMRDHHGRAGSSRAKTPTWTHNPHTLTISLRWTRHAMEFLESEYGWQSTTIWFNRIANGPVIHEWCEQRGYLCEVKFGTTTICTPTDKDLLMARLRFSDHQVPEPVF